MIFKSDVQVGTRKCIKRVHIFKIQMENEKEPM